MRILREYLGGAEQIDLDSTDGQLHFVMSVVQDQEVAAAYVDRFKDGEKEIVVNESEPLWIERWTLLNEDGTYQR